MKLHTGSVVRANAGRDSGGWFVVVDMDGDYCFIANGKERKLEKPKRKNMKHVQATSSVIELNNITDKKLRTLLREFGCTE